MIIAGRFNSVNLTTPMNFHSKVLAYAGARACRVRQHAFDIADGLDPVEQSISKLLGFIYLNVAKSRIIYV